MIFQMIQKGISMFFKAYGWLMSLNIAGISGGYIFMSILKAKKEMALIRKVKNILIKVIIISAIVWVVIAFLNSQKILP